MRSTILTAIMILCVGTGAGVIANASWYNLPWIKEIKRPPPVSPGPSTPNSTTTSGDPAMTSASADQGATPAKSTVAEPCAPAPGDKPGIVKIDCVLQFLEKGGATLIDAREIDDFTAGHLRGAIHLPSSAIYANVERIMNAGVQVNDVVIVYCGGGDCEASHNVADALRDDFQYQRVYVYELGWQEIESSGRFGAFVERGVNP